MIIQNGIVFDSDFKQIKADLVLKNSLIHDITPRGASHEPDAEIIDAKGSYVLPGLVDIHSHGCDGHDFCDADTAGLEAMLKSYCQKGVTSIIPATMSFPEPKLLEILTTALPYFNKKGFGAVLRGVNLEGPFFNPKKCGAQNPDYIINPDIDMFTRLYNASEGNILICDIAPELPNSLDFIRAVKDKCRVSLGHSNTNYDQASRAFEAGSTHVTHLFNAMAPFSHRDPGIIGAARDYEAYVEIITDGFHLHPSTVRSVFKWFDRNLICLISDSMRATGAPNGKYSLGDQPVLVQDGKAILEKDGVTIAGSVVDLWGMCRKAYSFGVPLEDVIRSATINPAKSVGLGKDIGSICVGKRADIVICDLSLNISQVICGGKPVSL